MSKQHEVTVTTSWYFTDDDMENIVITALEGGISYWACLDNTLPEFADKPEDTPTSEWCWKLLNEGKTLHFLDAEWVGEPDCEEWEMDLAALYKGIGMAIGKGNWDGDMDGLDADIADSVFQYAMLDDIVYG